MPATNGLNYLDAIAERRGIESTPKRVQISKQRLSS